ncbi:hypothetical protein LCGC14_1218700 [marine sediment metagenome]|uniref:J domain-containing protein n=1 Tax=marine sediment metagenome TaxID=412755 RepID=A0A0F9PGI4_9ZZZZ
MTRVVAVDKTRAQIRHQFALWDIDASEFEILWEEDRTSGRIIRRPGARVRYMRDGNWQEVACFGFPSRTENLRQCFLLLERLRIAEQHGVQYQGLTFTKDVATTTGEAARKESLMDAYDILGVSPDDPISLVKDIFRRKSQHYHPDKEGGTAEKFKRLNGAYELIMKSRGEK